MSDNVGYTPGTGEIIATDDIGGIQYQRVKTVWGVDGVANDVSVDNPLPIQAYGELIEAIRAMQLAINQLTKSVGFTMPNAAGQPIVEVRQVTATNLNANVTVASGTVTANIGTGTLAGLTTLTNQAQIGGIAANDYIPSLMHMQADNLRRNILVT